MTKISSFTYDGCCVSLGVVHDVLHRISRPYFLSVSHLPRRERSQSRRFRLVRRCALVGRGNDILRILLVTYSAELSLCYFVRAVRMRSISWDKSICPSVCLSVCPLAYRNKNSSGDEIANVNFYAVRPEVT